MRSNGDRWKDEADALLAEARDPRTPPDRLWALLNGDGKDAARAAAVNPNLPIERLFERLRAGEVRDAWPDVVDNPALGMALMLAPDPANAGSVGAVCAWSIHQTLARAYKGAGRTAGTVGQVFSDAMTKSYRGLRSRGFGPFENAARNLYSGACALAIDESIRARHPVQFEAIVSPRALGFVRFGCTEWLPGVWQDALAAGHFPERLAYATFTPNRRKPRR